MFLSERGWIVAFYVAAALSTGTHALLHKRDPRSAWGWIAVCWLFPVFGAVLYYLFGINRIQTRAVRVFGVDELQLPAVAQAMQAIPGMEDANVRELIRTGNALTKRSLCEQNAVQPFLSGAEAYDAMIAAIDAAQTRIDLATYIFRGDAAGLRFAGALVRAQARGVVVRVLLDGWSDAVYRPCGSALLTSLGLRPARFLPPRLVPPMLHINLRNHRKLLIVDDVIGFTGGMNIHQSHVAGDDGGPGIADLHFRLTGPVVTQMAQVFDADWGFATDEPTNIRQTAIKHLSGGDVVARVITEGPNEDVDRLLMIMISAISAAHERLWLMTPYFLPPATLTSALQAAALRGVDVSIIIPEHSDQPWMDWATRHTLAPLIARKIRFFARPAPFAHTKLMIVDDWYVQFGSANLDTRSLRLNFELNVEAYDRRLAARLAAHFDEVRSASRPIHRDDLLARSFFRRVRDALCWLGSPYL